ncbi:MAG: ankyrin repeat domain-containing protein [Treponema sp.]
MKKLLVSFVVLTFGVSLFSASREADLFRAVRDNDVDEVNYLLEHGASPNYAEGGYSTLMLACKNQNMEVVKLLLNKQANAAYSNEYNQTALMWAAKHCNNTAIVQALIDAHGNLNDVDFSGKTVLMYAMENSNANIISLILKRSGDANYNAVDNTGDTALMWAARANNPKAMELLIGRYPNVEYTHSNNHSDNVFTIAIKHGNLELLQILKKKIPNLDVDFRLPGSDQPVLFWAIENNASINFIEFLMSCYTPDKLLSTTDAQGNNIEDYAEIYESSSKLVKRKIKEAKIKDEKVRKSKENRRNEE